MSSKNKKNRPLTAKSPAGKKGRPAPQKQGTPFLFSDCKALVLSDGSRLRQKEWELYQAACQRAEKQTQQLKDFEEREIEAHRLWLESHFAEELATARTLNASLLDKVELIQEVEEYADATDLSLHEAYVLVHKARLDGTLEDLWQAVTDAQQAEDESDHSDEFEDLWQQFEDFFQAEFSEQSGARRQRTSSSHSENSSSPKATSKQPPDDDYLKGLYHKLVLRLHPDTNPSQTEEDRELFLRVQDAYQWRNVEGLERLYQQLTHSNQGLFHASEAPIGDIMKRRKQVEKRMKVLSQKLKEAKQHPAWGFLNRQQNTRALAQYAREIRFDIQEQVSVLETELQEVAGLISRWEKKAKRAAKAQSPRQKKKSKSPENQANTF